MLGIVGLGANDTEAGASDSCRATATFGLGPPGDLVLGLISDQMSGFTGPSDFRSVEFSIASNGTEIADWTFSSLATAQGFFDDRIIDLGSIVGPGVDLTFSYDLIANGPGGFGVDFALGGAAATSNFVVAAPEPSTWAMMLAGFVGLGLAAIAAPAVSSPRFGFPGSGEPRPRGPARRPWGRIRTSAFPDASVKLRSPAR